MALDTHNVIPGLADRPTTAGNAAVDRQEIKKLAQQFEAMLLTQMMREMRRSMLDEGEGGGLGQEAMVDTGDIAFGDALGRNGGFGFTAQMLDAFERQIQTLATNSAVDATPSSGNVTGAIDRPALPSILPPMADPALVPLGVTGTIVQTIAPTAAAATDITAAAPVSSQFGWRRDPMTGAAKFHNGVDIAVAYGRDVKAAAEGVVAFAGTQQGYGHTVVIDHGAGRQTRYAHLSDARVRAGERVAEGQVVGKSGNSGRSTGPHLHFEMLVDGQAVNPLTGLL